MSAPKTVPCDKCNEPIVLGEDSIYTIANKWDENNKLTSSRHGRCQPSPEQLRADFDRSLKRLRGLLRRL